MGAERETILVTGGAGYIGSHTCKLLAGLGHRVVVFDSLVTGHEDFVQWGDFEHGDLNDPASIAGAMEKHKPSAVVHFGALSIVGESFEKPELYERNNVGGSRNLLDAMVGEGVAKIVFSSTAAVYGNPQVAPVPETYPLGPINPYGHTKLAVERMLAEYEKSHGIRSVCLRYFNAAGADPDCEIGEHHDPETHLIPIVLDVALGRREKLMIFGDDYDTPDGTCLRDYIHIVDLAEAHRLALDHLAGEGESLALNLGNGEGYSVRQIVEAVEAITEKPIAVEIGSRREGDPARLVADASMARSKLGWKTQYAELKTIVEHAWAWHKKRFG